MIATMIYLCAVFIASLSQILLKRSALEQHENIWRQYLNITVISAYLMLIVSMFITIYAYKGVALKMGPVLETTNYFFVAVLGYIFLKEKLTKRQLVGVLFIVGGVVISAVGPI